MTTKTKSPMVRVQLDLPAEKIAEIEKLMAKTGVTTRKDFFENALTFFEWAVHQAETGRQIGGYDEGKDTFHEVTMPALDSARKRYERHQI